jgi:hypothetical protein
VSLTTSRIRPAGRIPSLSKVKQLPKRLLYALLLGVSAAHGEEAIDVYLPIFDIIQQGDALSAAGNDKKAVSKYREAQTALLNFKKGYTDWYGPMVSYRLQYVTGRIAELTDPSRALSGDKTGPGTGATQNQGRASAPASHSPVRLLEPGAQPRKVLRLHPKPGEQQTVDMALAWPWRSAWERCTTSR